MQEFGFIFPRCVRTKKHQVVWKECYHAIRTFFPESPILIIDDNSNQELIDDMPMTNTTVITSEFPGRGELLPYYYFYHKRPFRKAVCINDSMFIQERDKLMQAIATTDTVTFIWDFGALPDSMFMPQQYELLQALHPNARDRLHMNFDSQQGWTGCFATASIISLDFMDMLQDKYNILNLIHYCTTRPHRCSLERVFALCCCENVPHIRTLCGSIFYHKYAFSYNFDYYEHDKKNNTLPLYSIIKVWNGR